MKSFLTYLLLRQILHLFHPVEPWQKKYTVADYKIDAEILKLGYNTDIII